ncbi:hypothetical protein MRB53_028439 [Persea americana]|uniref:Uncharacterized protein n=1 Tax=Persea americana TaxID=3435 RepID=A0ACC2KFJ9_PERAE|nr:hypothetical protein MRB53_028439 [Persea americana]
MTSSAIEPDIKQYGCMIGLHGRAWLVDESTTLVQTRNLIELDPDHSSCHVLLSNVYAAVGNGTRQGM